MNNKDQIPIFNNEIFKIYKDSQRENRFQIESNIPVKNIFSSFTKLLIGTTITNDNKSLFFKAKSILSLRKYQSYLKKTQGISRFSYDQLITFIYCFVKQLNYLIKQENQCFYKYTLDNIIVIDYQTFLYLGYSHLKPINENNSLSFTTTFCKDGYISPSLNKINTIPSQIHYKTIYYSLGLVAIDLFSKDEMKEELLEEEEQEEQEEQEKNLKKKEPILSIQSIQGTKLYAFLERTLNEEVTKASFIFI
jgi:hypothetical protein